MRPAFSVVMAVYNRSRHIVPTIKSVLQQSFADFELIMVGDCCTDDTAAVERSNAVAMGPTSRLHANSEPRHTLTSAPPTSRRA